MDVELTGEEIDQLLREMIPKSRMGVVIYSKNFASSRWCLKELEMIMQRKKDKKMLLTPIFYKVNLDDLKHLTGQTAEDLVKHVADHGETTVQTWKDAITNFGRVSGLSYKDKDSLSEHEFIEKVIGKIKKMLERECPQHSVDQSKDLVNSQLSSSSHEGGEPEGMVTDKQCFTYSEILKITNNLDKLIARSGLGDVYSGKLNGAAVAVKILPPLLVQGSVSDVGSDSIEQSLRMQCSFRHENLVSLLGYCFDDHGKKAALVFEFIENGNLRKHLSGDNPRVLTWKERVRIATEIAQGLQYLHGMSITSYGNLQSTDIVFDEKMTAKILFFPCKRSQATNPYDHYISSINADAASSNFFLSNPLQKVQFNKKLDLHCFARILYELLVTGNEAPLTTWQNFVINLCQGNLQVDWRLGGVVNMTTVVYVTQCAYCCAKMDDFTLSPIGVC